MVYCSAAHSILAWQTLRNLGRWKSWLRSRNFGNVFCTCVCGTVLAVYLLSFTTNCHFFNCIQFTSESILSNMNTLFGLLFSPTNKILAVIFYSIIYSFLVFLMQNGTCWIILLVFGIKWIKLFVLVANCLLLIPTCFYLNFSSSAVAFSHFWHILFFWFCVDDKNMNVFFGLDNITNNNIRWCCGMVCALGWWTDRTIQLIRTRELTPIAVA